MFALFRSHLGPTITASAAVAALLFAAQSIHAQGTHLWTQTRVDDFEKGTPQGVAIGSNGELREGPGITELLTTPSTFVWSVAVDKSGTPFVGTGAPATVLRGSAQKDAKPFTLFESRDVSVQVVRIGPDGSLYAATVPSGKVYKLNANAGAKQDEASAKLVFDAAAVEAADGENENKANRQKSHYIWDMTFDSAGRLYIASGGPGAIYRVNPASPGAKPELFFKSDEQHIRCLTWDGKGNLIAGSDGSGLVYRISPQGKGYVLFEAPRREITSVAVASDGTIFAASVGDKSHNPLPPIPVQGVGTITFTIVQPGSLQAANASSSAPDGTEIYALAEDQAPRKIWSSKEDIVYALDALPDGVLAISGNRGHIFRIQKNGDYEDVAHVEAQQGLSLANVTGNDSVLIGTGNTGKLYSLGKSQTHEYASDVLDAGAYARFGRVEIDPDSQNFELLTRTGNVEQPVRGRGDWGWSDWLPVKDGAVQSPPGRFLQWKAVLREGGKIGSVGVNYLPVNAAPEIDDLVVAPGARLNQQVSSPAQQQNVNISFASTNQPAVVPVDTGSANSPLQAIKDRTAVTVRWAAHDDNGDDLVYSLYLRGDGERDWHLLKDNIAEKAYSFDAALIPDGGYRIKVVASDSPSHNPGEALTDSRESDRFEIDTTPPVVNALHAEEALAKCAQAPCPAPVHVTFDAEDAASPIAHAEYAIDAGPWQYIDPVGKLSDSKQEHYDFQIPAKSVSAKSGEHLITVRVYDRHENVGVAKTVIGGLGSKSGTK